VRQGVNYSVQQEKVAPSFGKILEEIRQPFLLNDSQGLAIFKAKNHFRILAIIFLA
jgi:hypothetical protein